MSRRVRFVAPSEVRVEDRPTPTPDTGEVLVRAAVSAVSPGTELLVYRGTVPTEDGETLGALDGDRSYPLSYGYATVGRVEAVGDGVDSKWLDRRVFAYAPHGEHVVAPVDDVVPVPEDVPSDEAALLASVETALTFALDATPRVGERIVVFGQGVVGLLTTGLLAETALTTVVAADCYGQRRALAERFGASETVEAPVDGTLAERFPEGVDLAVEVSGDPDALDEAIDATGYGGRVLVGSWYGTKRANLALGGSFHRDRIEIRSSQVSTIAPDLRGRWDRERRWSAAWDAIRSLPVDRLLTHRIPVSDAPRAYRLLDERPEEAVGVLLTHD
ncbi:zinc-binding dehydrogenase [Halomarina oriensis]|uniref:Zinc-binding dehydrogenase n=1 Tax=Halomarina oriensis TaxID=671145 RepID=A0A6B0GHY2_9EURY|nr:zinc-binding dehydrogenase [Halomarina oriensis]MWG34220.1 zinc-binding dehydrogenase [Halomarina oriensis]